MSGPDDPRTPTLARLLQRSAAALLDGMHVTLPARVESYDATRQCVDAQPLIKREFAREDGSTGVERLPVVTRCPVVFPGSGGYRLTFPIEAGSVVVLHFTSASLDRWLAIGGEVAPEDGRKLSLSDAFAVPGGHSFAGSTAPTTTAPEDAMVLHAALLRLGGPAATDPVVRKSDLDAFITTFNVHVHAGVTTGAGVSAVPTGPQGALPCSTVTKTL